MKSHLSVFVQQESGFETSQVNRRPEQVSAFAITRWSIQQTSTLKKILSFLAQDKDDKFVLKTQEVTMAQRKPRPFSLECQHKCCNMVSRVQPMEPDQQRTNLDLNLGTTRTLKDSGSESQGMPIPR